MHGAECPWYETVEWGKESPKLNEIATGFNDTSPAKHNIMKFVYSVLFHFY